MFTREVLNGFEMSARIAAIEIPAVHRGHRAFVGVYPPLVQKSIPQWRVRRFEIPEDLMEKYFGEEQLIDSQFIQLDTLEQVEELLAKWNLDTAMFAAPWKSDFPL